MFPHQRYRAQLIERKELTSTSTIGNRCALESSHSGNDTNNHPQVENSANTQVEYKTVVEITRIFEPSANTLGENLFNFVTCLSFFHSNAMRLPRYRLHRASNAINSGSLVKLYLIRISNRLSAELALIKFAKGEGFQVATFMWDIGFAVRNIKIYVMFPNL